MVDYWTGSVRASWIVIKASFSFRVAQIAWGCFRLCTGSLPPSAGVSTLCGGHFRFARCAGVWRTWCWNCKFAATKAKSGMTGLLFKWFTIRCRRWFSDCVSPQRVRWQSFSCGTVGHFIQWCDASFLNINASKTKELCTCFACCHKGRSGQAI